MKHYSPLPKTVKNYNKNLHKEITNQMEKDLAKIDTYIYLVAGTTLVLLVLLAYLLISK